MIGPKIAFCTTCRGRVEHLAQTLPQNLLDSADYANAVFVVLDYNDRKGLKEYLLSGSAAAVRSAMNEGRVVFYYNPMPARFHMANAKNMAHRLGIREGADILVTLDADNYTGPGFAEFIADRFSREANIFLCPDFQALPPPGHRFNKDNPLRLGRGFAGRLAIRAQDFIKVGGYDESFDTWRGEDIDIIARLDRLGVGKRRIDAEYLNAIAHGSAVRFKEYPHAKVYEDDTIYSITSAATNTIVNNGSFGLGTVFRNFGGAPIDLNPVPTRIFGIGMQRTATSSLHDALGILNYDSAHWKSAEWARAIWWEMNRWGRSATVEREYAICDNPIPLLYRKLDAAYPGSKFILTVRDEADWVKSVETLWSYDLNPHRHSWDGDGFTHKMHGILYGRVDFDAETFLACYRQHNAEVLAYFSGRAGDLLVMNMSNGAGWEELCPFLSVPLVETPFPHSNQSANKGRR